MTLARPLLFASLLVLALPGCASRPSPQKIVQQMLKTYAGLQSYEDHCQTTARHQEGRKPSVVMEERFAYQAPNRFFLGVHSGEHIIAIASSNGKTIKCVTSERNA